MCLAEVSQACAGIYQSLEGAGDITEDQPHWVISSYLFVTLMNYAAVFAAEQNLRKPLYCLTL